MPTHCQKAAIENNSVGFDDLHPTEYNIEKIIIADSPLPDFTAPNSESDEMLKYTLTSTSKKDKENKKRQKEIKAQNPIAYVQSLPAADALIESNNAEFGIDDKDVPLPSKGEIENKLKERVKAGSVCANAIENLINRLGEKANPNKPRAD